MVDTALSRPLHRTPPDRESGLARLRDFVPGAGAHYAEWRGYDPGPEARDAVSHLSAYLRHRLVTEEEVLSAVIGRHGREPAAAFIGEIFWRTYAKGWFALRPSAWAGYRGARDRAWDDVQTQSGLRERWQAACRGETGIACFDAWARELADTGYLHNHARMWFASIWIFTLRLPWPLGADFFLRHLLDGDPASNTLGWRWVAGLHTPGKTYLARPDNIRTYTGGRFDPQGELAETAVPPECFGNPAPDAAPEGDAPNGTGRAALLLHEDDLTPEWMLDLGLSPVATATLDATAGLTHLAPAAHVTEFKVRALEDCLTRNDGRLGPVTRGLTSAAEIAAWARAADADRIVTSYPPVGPSADIVAEIDHPDVVRPLRAYDRRAWGGATAGYFKLRKTIPALLDALEADPGP